MLRKNFEGRREIKKATAKVRQEARAKRSAEEQLRRLDRLLGEGCGAKKERARLTKEIASRVPEETKEKAKKVKELMEETRG